MTKHAFLILAHNELEVLKTLLRLLDHPRNDIFLHIDKRAENLRENIESLHLNYSHLYILSNPICVYWGDISQLKAEFRLFGEALKHGPYLYYHLLSGVDLPIKTQDVIHRFFDEHQGKEFLGFWHGQFHEKDMQKKLGRYYLFTKYMKGGGRFKHNSCALIRNLTLALQKVSFFQRKHQMRFKKGYQWVSLTHDFSEYLYARRKEIQKIFKYTLCPDEIFIHSFIWNSPFKNRIYNSENPCKGSVRYIDWQRGNPYVWKEEDVEELLLSPYLFARKFSGRYLKSVQKIEEVLTEKSSLKLLD